jgi:acylpyruvate hydrolase
MKTILIKNSSKEIPINKIVCVGRNYVEHIQELGNEQHEKPVIFLKTVTSVIYSDEEIIYPSFSDDMHHETELVLLIGSMVKDANRIEAEKAIVGYGVGLDMTLRDVQNDLKKKGHPWTISKCFDTSTVLSDFVSADDYKPTLDETVTLKVNGEVRQNDQLNKMIFNPAQIVEYISSLMTLEEGDLIFTGTPKGVSRVNRGDVLEARIENISQLNCKVV